MNNFYGKLLSFVTYLIGMIRVTGNAIIRRRSWTGGIGGAVVDIGHTHYIASDHGGTSEGWIGVVAKFEWTMKRIIIVDDGIGIGWNVEEAGKLDRIVVDDDAVAGTAAAA